MKTTCSLSSPARWTTITPLLAIAISLAVGPPAWAASASELLEQGIYAEETKGDLDAALQLYKQAVSEAKATRAVASQAQFRLGVCYYKKKESAAAMAAFEQLVRDFPEQKELVAQAGDYLFRALPLLAAPWEDGEELRFDLKPPGGPKCGSVTATVNAGETNGQRLWLVGEQDAVLFFTDSIKRVEVDAATFKPLRSRRTARVGGEVDTVYLSGKAEVKVKGQAEAKHAWLPGAVYDDYELFDLIRRLPLAANYSVSLFSAGMKGMSGDRSPEPNKLQVVGVEKVQVPAGTYECFKVEIGTNSSAWYSTGSRRYPVKFQNNGPGWPVELAAVNRRPAGEPAQYRDPGLGFSLTAPPGWLIDRYAGEDASAAVRSLANAGGLEQGLAQLLLSLWNDLKAEITLCILNPEPTSLCWANVARLESLKGNARQSPRAWAEENLARATKVLTDLQVRTNGWQQLTAAGQSAVSAIGDCGQGDYRMTAYGVWIFDNSNAVNFCFASAPKDFERLRPSFDALVHSYTRSQ
jgi:hypothetical protein